MTDIHDMPAQIAAATAYESLFVPAVFEEWAVRLAKAVHIAQGDRVLDVACGTGIVARKVAELVGSSGAVAGLDVAPGMLEVGRRLAPQVDFRQGCAESLPWPDAFFDAVLCQFGLMFFTDRRAAVLEMLRVLRPGGRLGIAVWASLEDIPAYAAEVALLERIAGAQAANALRAPFVLGDPAEFADLLESAEVTSVDVVTHKGTASFPSIRSMVEADLRGWLPLMGVVLPEEQIQHILQEAETVLRPYITEDGKFRFVAPAHIGSGWKS